MSIIDEWCDGMEYVGIGLCIVGMSLLIFALSKLMSYFIGFKGLILFLVVFLFIFLILPILLGKRLER